MSVQRYGLSLAVYESDEQHIEKQKNGDYVLYTDHLEDVRQEMFHLLSILADIRRESGVGDGPMLSELAGEIGKLTAERDAAVRERDAACEALRFYADGENYKYPESGDLAVLQDDGSKARAALAKIEGKSNGQDG